MSIQNTIKVYQKELSIQITLSGFSFSVDTPRHTGNGVVESYDFDANIAEFYQNSAVVEWCVPSVLIIPFEHFFHGSIDNYLQAASMLDKRTERSVFAVKGDVVAVWSVENELYDYISSRLTNVEHSHPLLRLIDMETRSSAIIVEVDSASIMHIVSKSEYGLEAAHSVKINAVDDIIFYAKQLSTQSSLTAPTLYVTGGVDEFGMELMAQYFNEVIKL